MTERVRRKRNTGRQAAFDKLDKLHSAGGLLDDDDDDNAEYVDEQEYQRRRRVDDFVVDEDGYAVHEEDDEDDEGSAGAGAGVRAADHDAVARKRARGSGKAVLDVAAARKTGKALANALNRKSRSRPVEEAPENNKKISEFLGKRPKTKAPAPAAAPGPDEDILDSLLQDLQQNPTGRNIPPRRHVVRPRPPTVIKPALAPAAPADPVADPMEDDDPPAQDPPAQDPPAQDPPAQDPPAQDDAGSPAAPTTDADGDVNMGGTDDSGLDDAALLAAVQDVPTGGLDDDALLEAALPTRNFAVDDDTADKDGKDGKGKVESFGDWWASAPEQQQAAPPAAVDAESADMLLDADGNMFFYWLDASEEYALPGTVFLFGKVLLKDGSMVSCCVTVRNIERNLFVLPRRFNEEGNEVSMADVKAELRGVMSSHGIRSWAAKPVKRNYAFELPGVPRHETDYLKVLMGYDMPQLPQDLTGESFSRIFGTNTSALEHFIIKRDLMGPCWLRITNPGATPTPLSWCRCEVSVDDPKTVRKVLESDARPQSFALDPPPLVVMSISLKTVLNRASQSNEIVMASVLVHSKVRTDGPTPERDGRLQHFVAVRKPPNSDFPFGFSRRAAAAKADGLNIIECPNERSLLSYLVGKLQLIDPDVVTGHNFTGFGLDVLLHRMKDNHVAQWSKLGRLRRTHFPKLQANAGGMSESTWAERHVMAGRLVCDTYVAAKDLIKEDSYKLEHLSLVLLGRAHPSIGRDDIGRYFSTADALFDLTKHAANDAYVVLQLVFKLMVLPLTRQLTCLAGNLWSRSLSGARSERNEYLLLHEFHRLKYIVPDRAQGVKTLGKAPGARRGGDGGGGDGGDDAAGGSKKGRRKPAYVGGLVLEPKRGLYDHYVMVLDFNSLYPSVIQEYNICFTTVERNAHQDGGKAGDDAPSEPPKVPDASCAPGVLPRVIRTLVERRRQVKQMIKTERDAQRKQQLDIRQKALKLTANSMYGCLGFSHSRFFARPLAELITMQGRNILSNTVMLARDDLRLDVIYGDTDSIMVNTQTVDMAEALKIGAALKKAVNKHYKLLEIEIDGVFQRMLLLRKKKYAALALVEQADGAQTVKRETKGLDLVRRDWCPLSKDIGHKVLDQILSQRQREEVVENIHGLLRECADQIANNQIHLRKFIITKSLTKNPEDYPDAKSQPHVQVALWMRAQNQTVQVGDFIEFVICQPKAGAGGSSSESYAQRAYHPSMVLKAEGALKIDTDWYLTQQIHPPVARLCEEIDGTDAMRLADCLGLDSSKFKAKLSDSGTGGVNATDLAGENEHLASKLLAESNFDKATKLIVKCPRCMDEGVIEGVFRKSCIPDNTAENSALPTDPVAALGLYCKGCREQYPSGYLANALTRMIRREQRFYYEQWHICDDSACGLRTRQISVAGAKCPVIACSGTLRPEYPSERLFTQLLYLRTLFDRKTAVQRCPQFAREGMGNLVSPSVRRDLDALYKHVNAHVAVNGYGQLDWFGRLYGER